AQLAHGAVNGRCDDLGARIDRAYARTQCACEELVEAGIAERVGLGRFAHLGPESAHEGANERVLDQGRAYARQSKHQARKEMLRKELLQRDEQRVAHQPFLFDCKKSPPARNGPALFARQPKSVVFVRLIFRSGAAVRRSWAICLASNGGVKTATSRAWVSSRKTVAE